MTDLHPTRFFEASSNTIEYLIEEWADDEEEKLLREAGELITEAEGDIFEQRKCPDCSKVVFGTDVKDANTRFKDHQSAIHK